MQTTVKTIEALGACKLIGTHPAGSLDWLIQRSKTIGGSDVAAAMNLSPYKSRYALWAEKSGLTEPIKISVPMRMGQLFEDGISTLFKEQHPELFVEAPLNWTFESLANPSYHANPDGIITDKDGNLYLLEIKHTSSYWSELPKHYELQVLWYMYVTGLQNPAIVCAVTGGHYREFQVEYDRNLVNDMLEAVNSLLGLIEAGSEPELDNSVSTYETVRELLPEVYDAEIELGQEYVDLMGAKAIHELADQNFTGYKSKVIAAMGGAKYGYYAGERVITLQTRGNKPFITFKKES